MELQERICAKDGCSNKLDPRNRTGFCRSHRERTPHAGQFTSETARAARAARKAKAV